ncbi:hypothetical protein AAFF_G00330530 [Aldrovandia affinis]|uniref:Uncharacterized protein n=1 Tax=Aldrovandia affinis TaxID=143900 RepID=A0AAD7R8Z3_9TELE|nr:hypothetical protein AAFF_G00330530 [Aldrovandia affinis]
MIFCGTKQASVATRRRKDCRHERAALASLHFQSTLNWDAVRKGKVGSFGPHRVLSAPRPSATQQRRSLRARSCLAHRARVPDSTAG